MQRRLNLAMALVHDPDILILDEPEAGLDPQSRVKVREYIQSLARTKTVILTTHNMDEADRVADRIGIIDHGKLLVLDTPGALKSRVGEGDVIEVQVENLVEDKVDVLQSELGEQVQAVYVHPRPDQTGETRSGTVSVRALDGVNALSFILDTLKENGMQPANMRIRENTLEDVFIQLTGRRLRE
jgi:ABC-2 type transport system ATP-binding protein